MKNLSILLIVFFLSACNGQTKSNKEAQKNDTIKPQTKITVHKEYDEQGNLISLDSTYSYFYSNIKNDSILEREIFDKFKLDFDNRFQSMDSLFMKDFFNESPFRINDFYTEDYFQQNFKLHQERINDMFKRMDSLKNSFYKKQIFKEE